MSRFWLYARVSTADQNTDQQISYMKQWCEGNSIEINGIVQDKQSGRLPLTDRKKFKQLLEYARVDDQTDGILVQNLDRLTRNWDDVTYIERFFRENWDTCMLKSCGESVDLATSAGRFVFRVLMATNCQMPELMREKQCIGIERARKEGKYKGRKPGSRNKARR